MPIGKFLKIDCNVIVSIIYEEQALLVNIDYCVEGNEKYEEYSLRVKRIVPKSKKHL